MNDDNEDIESDDAEERYDYRKDPDALNKADDEHNEKTTAKWPLINR